MIAAASGIVVAIGLTAPLAWKWQLGVRKVVIAVALIGIVWAVLLSLFLSPSVLLTVCITLGSLVTSLALLAWRFYRDPDREPPDAADVVVSPADGEVIYIRQAVGGELPVSTKHGRSYRLDELTGCPLEAQDATVIGIAMNFLDVHVNRAPIAGRVVRRQHFPGAFGSLRLPEMTFENERATTVIENPRLQLAVVQIASRLVRQIVGWVADGDLVALGSRIGVIRLGSQVDVVLPTRPDLSVLVSPGDKVRAAVSVLASIAEQPPVDHGIVPRSRGVADSTVEGERWTGTVNG